MAGLKLDGAGQVKMATLEEALHIAATLNAHAERMAQAVKSNQKNTATFVMAFKRSATPLVGKLKGQFGMIADIVATTILNISRPGGGDVLKVRAMREGVAQIKVQLEIAVAHVKEKHAAHDEKPAAGTAET
ncbi:MAG: hypothetical protein HY275_02575 [Gemmatimonadetes bacterium]|nr:hypothetical protein [Gemmatimonadota bacterium]